MSDMTKAAPDAVAPIKLVRVGTNPYPDEVLHDYVERLDVDAVPALRVSLFTRERGGTNTFAIWPGVGWTLEFRKAETATSFRRDLDEFIRGWVEKAGAEAK